MERETLNRLIQLGIVVGVGAAAGAGAVVAESHAVYAQELTQTSAADAAVTPDTTPTPDAVATTNGTTSTAVDVGPFANQDINSVLFGTDYKPKRASIKNRTAAPPVLPSAQKTTTISTQDVLAATLTNRATPAATVSAPDIVVKAPNVPQDVMSSPTKITIPKTEKAPTAPTPEVQNTPFADKLVTNARKLLGKAYGNATGNYSSGKRTGTPIVGSFGHPASALVDLLNKADKNGRLPDGSIVGVDCSGLTNYSYFETTGEDLNWCSADYINKSSGTVKMQEIANLDTRTPNISEVRKGDVLIRKNGCGLGPGGKISAAEHIVIISKVDASKGTIDIIQAVSNGKNSGGVQEITVPFSSVVSGSNKFDHLSRNVGSSAAGDSATPTTPDTSTVPAPTDTGPASPAATPDTPIVVPPDAVPKPASAAPKKTVLPTAEVTGIGPIDSILTKVSDTTDELLGKAKDVGSTVLDKVGIGGNKPGSSSLIDWLTGGSSSDGSQQGMTAGTSAGGDVVLEADNANGNVVRMPVPSGSKIVIGTDGTLTISPNGSTSSTTKTPTTSATPSTATTPSTPTIPTKTPTPAATAAGAATGAAAPTATPNTAPAPTGGENQSFANELQRVQAASPEIINKLSGQSKALLASIKPVPLHSAADIWQNGTQVNAQAKIIKDRQLTWQEDQAYMLVANEIVNGVVPTDADMQHILIMSSIPDKETARYISVVRMGDIPNEPNSAAIGEGQFTVDDLNSPQATDGGMRDVSKNLDPFFASIHMMQKAAQAKSASKRAATAQALDPSGTWKAYDAWTGTWANDGGTKFAYETGRINNRVQTQQAAGTYEKLMQIAQSGTTV